MGSRSRSRPCRPRDPAASSSAITISDWTFGAPVTEPGGKVARSSSASPTSGRSRPSTSVTRCHRPGCASAVGRRGAVTEPYSQTRPMSLRIRSTIITCSAASLSESRRRRSDSAASAGSLGRSAVPLIGPLRTLPALTTQEQLRRERDDAALRACRTLPCIRGTIPRSSALRSSALAVPSYRPSSRRQMLA